MFLTSRVLAVSHFFSLFAVSECLGVFHVLKVLSLPLFVFFPFLLVSEFFTLLTFMQLFAACCFGFKKFIFLTLAGRNNRLDSQYQLLSLN